MRGHEIGHRVLVQMLPLHRALELLHEGVVDLHRRLAHEAQHAVGDVLRRHAQLAAHVVPAQLGQESFVRVRHEIVKTHAGPHKNFLHPGQCAEFAQKLHIVGVVHLQVGAGLRKEALAVPAGAEGQLFPAGRLPELRCRAADVVDVALEIRVGEEKFCLVQNGLVAAGLDDPPLVEGERTEAAPAVAAAVGRDRKLDVVGESGNPARFVVHRVPRAGVGKGVDIVHFLRGKRLRRWVLDDEGFPVVSFVDPFRREGVRVFVLDAHAVRTGALIAEHILKIRQPHGVVDVLLAAGLPDRAVDEGDVAHIEA